MEESAGDLEVRDAGEYVFVGGELDASTAAKLEVVVWSKVAYRPPQVVVDLRDVTFVDFAAMSRLLWLQGAAAEQRVEIVLQPLSRAATRVIELLELAGSEDRASARRRATRCSRVHHPA